MTMSEKEYERKSWNEKNNNPTDMSKMVKLLIVCVGFGAKMQNITEHLMNDHALIENIMHIDVQFEDRSMWGPDSRNRFSRATPFSYSLTRLCSTVHFLLLHLF